MAEKKSIGRRFLRFLLKTLKVIFITLFSLNLLIWGLNTAFGSKPDCFWCLSSHVIHDYYLAAGISKRTMGNPPEKTIKIYGQPLWVEDFGARRMIFHYGDFDIIFRITDSAATCDSYDEYAGYGLTVHDPSYEIREDIHVGSTREQILHAYRKCPSIRGYISRDEEPGESLEDTGIRNGWENSLRFTYDENDVVTSITYCPCDRYLFWRYR